MSKTTTPVTQPVTKCDFCKEPLSRTPSAGRCPRCGVAYLFTRAADDTAKGQLAELLSVGPEKLKVVETPLPEEVGGGVFYCGWDGAEILTPTQVVKITGKGRATIGDDLEVGLFTGAYQEKPLFSASGERTPRFWKIPRSAVMDYMLSARSRSYNLSPEAREQRRAARNPTPKKTKKASAKK